MAKPEDLKPGTRVRVPFRKNATGTIAGDVFTDNSATPPRPVVKIKFDGGGTGFNWLEQIELLDA